MYATRLDIRRAQSHRAVMAPVRFVSSAFCFDCDALFSPFPAGKPSDGCGGLWCGRASYPTLLLLRKEIALEAIEPVSVGLVRIMYAILLGACIRAVQMEVGPRSVVRSRAMVNCQS